MVVYLLGGKGFRLPAEKKPAGQINDLVSVPIFGVTVLLPFFFLPSSRSTPFPSMSLANGDRIAAFLFFFLFLQRFFSSPGEGRRSVRKEERSLPRGNPSARQIGTESRKDIRSQDLPPGIGIYETSTWILLEDQETRAMTRIEWRTFSIIC